MFTQKLRLPYLESPMVLPNSGIKNECAQYNLSWDVPGVGSYDYTGAYEIESESALSRIYNFGEEGLSLMSPLMTEPLARVGMFTPEMKPQPRLDDLELQVLSSAPSELSSWSENEDKPPPLVKYDSESSLEHLHSMHFSPEQFAECGPKMSFGHTPDMIFPHNQMHGLDACRADPYHLGWRYLHHETDTPGLMDLTDLVDGVFASHAAPDRPDQGNQTEDHAHERHEHSSGVQLGVRTGLGPPLHAVRPSLHARVNKISHSFSGSSRGKPKEELRRRLAESFMLQPWPVDPSAGIAGSNKSHEMSAALRLPLPCLSATDRWNKHIAKYTLDPKLSGDMVCSHCDQTFTDVAKYTRHLDEEKVVHDNFCPDVSCAFAALGFRYRWLLRRHICNHHLKDYNNKKLRKSLSTPGEKNTLTDNFLSHVYVCKKSNCLRAFYRLDSLLRHEKLIHSVCNKQKRKDRLKLSKCDPKVFE